MLFHNITILEYFSFGYFMVNKTRLPTIFHNAWLNGLQEIITLLYDFYNKQTTNYLIPVIKME